MKIISVKKVVGCLEGTNVRDIYFDEICDADFARHLMTLGKSVYRDDIDKPFYKIMVRGKYTLKGSVGNSSARLLLPSPNDEPAITELSAFVEKFSR